FRLWQSAERVIQGYFHSIVGPKAVGPSGHHSNLIIQALDSATGDLALGAEPIEEQFLVGAQHAGDSHHRLDSATQGAPSPIIQEVARPGQRAVAPEVLEDFLQDPGPSGDQFAGCQGVELLSGFAAHAAAPSQQFPSHVFEVSGLGRCDGSQSSAFSPPHLIYGLVQVRRDGKAIPHTPSPIEQTTPPSDRRIPNWFERPAPSLATTAAAPNGTESTSW